MKLATFKRRIKGRPLPPGLKGPDAVIWAYAKWHETGEDKPCFACRMWGNPSPPEPCGVTAPIHR